LSTQKPTLFRPTALDLAMVPSELRERVQWVLWRLEWRNDKWTKTPWQVIGLLASSTDPSTWTTFEIAVDAYQLGGYDGIGFVFTEDDPYFGVDVDELDDAERDWVVATLDSYTERSVSGRGVHVIGRGQLDGHGRHPKQIGIFTSRRFFIVTGDIVDERLTIEDRQDELGLVLARFVPPPEPSPTRTRVAEPVDLDDRDLIERATNAKNGALFTKLWNGGIDDYPSASEADEALCHLLAFWTGRDFERIDRLFRSSGLMREKWERDDYRERTIERAIEGTNEIYTPSRTQVRPASDAGPTHPASDTGDGAESAGASRVPYVVGTQGRDAPAATPAASDTEVRPEPELATEEADAFAAVDERSADPILGDDENAILVAGGSVVYYGDGGAGKTTLNLDQAFHLCAGIDWLGLHVPRPCVVLWIENEGPRGKFRKKLRAKLDAWDGPALEGRLHVLTQPWARFSFANDAYRAELVEIIRTLDIDVVIAGPVARLGAEGGGTPEQIQAFVDLLELVRADLDRPLAYELIHHENKQGGVSGAWEGATDTLVHVQARGNGHTAIVWQKTRWAPEIHGRTWKLNWRPGERFEIDDTPETTDEEIADKLLELVRAAPGGSWNSYETLLSGQATRKRAVRDQLIADEKLINAGTEKAMRLFLPAQTHEPTQASFGNEDDAGGGR
jgi:hypothetical protein